MISSQITRRTKQTKLTPTGKPVPKALKRATMSPFTPLVSGQRVISLQFSNILLVSLRDFLLKPELLRAIVDCGFEHPSEVQHECIPQAILGTDILCQAKSGMGKTAVFTLACLQQLSADDKGAVKVLVICHTRELAYQIKNEFVRFSKYFPDIKTHVVYGGINISEGRICERIA